MASRGPSATGFGAGTARNPLSGVRNNNPPPPSPAFAYSEEDLILREDYSRIIKDARETLGITQEDLGRKINEKPSMIGHLENGSMKPDDVLAKKLEHFLKIQLFVPFEETENEAAGTSA